MSIKLTVWTPDKALFEAYYYGYGEIEDQKEVHGQTCTVVDYSDDRYHAEYQANRFASGLYHAEVWEGAPNTYEDTSDEETED